MPDPAVVLDASALLALLNAEPGAARVAAVLPQAVVSSVNLSEVVAKLADIGMPEAEIHAALDGLGLDVVPFDESQAYRAGMLRPASRALGLSLGDRAGLALAMELGCPVLTTDQQWQALAAPAVVEVVR
jgi:PIN domain nuclease of toxin-antitoxin system